ncbi:hypothetical protein [Bacillus sp. FJAT-29937]|uniref:hypothetical protein n=1 Tax=Bacillus sp. FJAT-29937 TaxID=1720553 RepID=UPI000835CF7B|nr:hypothetical protein [Bacillus sp. FJAT-29937]
MLSKLKKVLVWAVIAYPLSWLIEKLLKIPIFETYQSFLQISYQYLYQWWDWLLILLLSYLISKNIAEVKYETMELVRRNRLLSELERWAETPYVPPLMFYYLMNPPQAVSGDLRKITDNRFYQMVVSFFRDRIYIHGQIQRKLPIERPSLWKVIGIKDLFITLAAFSIGFLWFSFVTLHSMDNWISGWERFTIPGVIYFALYSSMKLQGYLEMRYKKINQTIKQHFGEVEPQILWRELFPDQEKGKTIISAWEAEREKRQRYTNMLQGNVFVSEIIQNYSNPALAPYPYPSKEIPDWAESMEHYTEEKLQEWAKEEKKQTIKSRSKNSNVIDLSKRRKQTF